MNVNNLIQRAIIAGKLFFTGATVQTPHGSRIYGAMPVDPYEVAAHNAMPTRQSLRREAFKARKARDAAKARVARMY